MVLGESNEKPSQAAAKSGANNYSFVVANTPAEFKSKSNTTRVRKQALHSYLNSAGKSEASTANSDSQWHIPSGGIDPIWSTGDLRLDASKQGAEIRRSSPDWKDVLRSKKSEE